MYLKYFIINVFLVVIIALVVFKYLGFVLNSYDLTYHQIRPSSVWCLGDNHSQRRCRFVNLCFKTDTNDYIFLTDDKQSLKSGLPLNRFSPTLADMSSVVNHNQFYFNYVEIPFDVLIDNLTKNYEIKTLLGKTLIMSRFKTDNLMHYFHDDLIPLYATLQELGGKQQISAIFLDDIYNQPLYKPFNNKDNFEVVFPKSIQRSELNKKTIYCFEESFIGLHKSITWYDYGFRYPQQPINRTSIDSQLISKTIRKLNISRKQNRKILNEKVFVEFISDFTKLAVIIVDDLSDNLEDIIKTVMCAQILIGVHGSALILSLFLSPGSSLIELFPFAINPNYVKPFKTLTQLQGMQIHYFYWKNHLKNNTFVHKEYTKEFGGIEHLTHEQQLKIENTDEEVGQQLCCSDPYWLYRIYQDTVVDLTSFTPILSNALEKSMQPMIKNDLKIEPTVVTNLMCFRYQTNDLFYIKIIWQKPWNLNYIKTSQKQIKYEIIIQEFTLKSANVSVVDINEFTIYSKPILSYNIWIRCKLDHIYGPFNINPLMC
ncbi:protein O-linked-mannose beta-1,4-N-acetylglucosaminyltransferase 2-like [Oppia nitens]|uniref:protein O-linked-mannose beta-1,4-N-acetylglucosaminyltransferase 2-like n=1 Tax=Oppia nitens TaxID=1686743 RepID=UPI0023DC4BAE|nr:protein O-linked-mannose beta-1,4-N-acetylglucosaminyltransferase 2-like [Oppia nitens]